jgi:hypothetical protein
MLVVALFSYVRYRELSGQPRSDDEQLGRADNSNPVAEFGSYGSRRPTGRSRPAHFLADVVEPVVINNDVHPGSLSEQRVPRLPTSRWPLSQLRRVGDAEYHRAGQTDCDDEEEPMTIQTCQTPSAWSARVTR